MVALFGSRGCYWQISTSLKSGWNHTTEHLAANCIIAEEENLVRETETLVAPTRYAVVATDEEPTSLRGDRSSQLSSESAHFHVAAGKGNQSRSTCFVITQETGYCTETATQGETPFLSHNGKHQTYQRPPCESKTGVGHHGATDTLTATDRVPRDNAAPLNDNRTSGLPAARGSTERILANTERQRTGALSPCHSQPLTSQSSHSSSNSSPPFYTDYSVSVPLGPLTGSAQHKDGEAAPGETSCPSSGKPSVSTFQCGRVAGGVITPDAPAGRTKYVHSSTPDQRLAHAPRVGDDSVASLVPDLHLVTSVQATDGADASHLADLVVAVVQLPKSMARSMTVNVQMHSHVGSPLKMCHTRTSLSADKATGSSPRKKPMQRVKSPNGTHPQAGCILFSGIAAFEEGTFLPLPSQQAVERSIGKGGNGTISIVYFKGVEFAVKRTHLRQVELDILTSLHHDNILSLQAVMMGEEDPQRPSRHLCYHFMPRMSGDLQGYLTKVGHGALSNLLMQHKEDPTMLQLVVDNTKHILKSTLKALAYLHSSNIVHNDVKPSNFLVAIQCGCESPLTCNHGQNFAVKLADFDSAMDVKKLQTSHSTLKQLYRNTPSGTPGYRPPEYVLVATRTIDELDSERLTAADVWSFGCSVLKIFLSHSGPHTQKQMASVHLWSGNSFPWKEEGASAREVLKIALLERVYPNWPQLWDFVAVCIKVAPTERATCWKLSNHAFFSS